MFMQQFFVEEQDIAEGIVTISGSQVRHIRNVLRMKPGERIRVSSPGGRSCLCALTQIAETFVQARIVCEDVQGTELSAGVILFQGLPKGDKMELIIQKAVELGAASIVPVSMKNCVVKLDEKRAASKVKRWQAIAESAAAQSKRSVIPRVYGPVSWKEALLMAAESDAGLVPYENERGMAATQKALGAIRPGQSVSILIGPEGGFAPEEIAQAREAGIQPVSLGRRILRTETAGLAMLAILMYHIEIMVQGDPDRCGSDGLPAAPV